MTNQEFAAKVIDRILGNLEESTWAESFPRAAKELKEYRDDMIQDVKIELIHRMSKSEE